MSPIDTEHEDRVRTLLSDLADSTPIRPRDSFRQAERTPERAFSRPEREGGRPVELSDAGERPSRRAWVLAAAAIVAVFVLVGVLLVNRDSADRFAVDAGDVPVVDTAALADGRLAFVMENDLFLADGPSGEVRRITDTGSGEEVSHVSWSHDGEWVAFSIHDESGLWVAKRDGSEHHRLGRSPTSYAWSPTANELVYATTDEVRIAQVDGSSRALRGGTAPRPHTTVVWSPSGDQVAFAGPNGELAIATLRDRPDPGWRAGDSPPVSQVLAWPTDDLVLVATPVAPVPDDPVDGEQAQVQVLGFHPSTGGAQGLVAFPGPFDPGTDLAVGSDGRTFVLAPPNAGPTACAVDGATANCGYDLGLQAGSTLPALGTAADRAIAAPVAVIAGGELFVRRLWWPPAISVPASFEFVVSLGSLDDSTRGTIEIDGVGYGVVPEPPVWIGGDALIVRVNERDLVRIDVGTGERTTIVAGPRFRPPADDYPGGYGFAYWQPTP